MPTVSIVIPTFNRAHLVTRAIETALNQTHPCEVILCDHGSRDDTPSVAARYQDRVRYVRREEDHGPIACWRDGIEQASGEFVHLTYDDDWLEPGFIARCLTLFRDDVGFVYSSARIHNESTDTSALHLGFQPPGIRPMPEFVHYLLRTPGLPVSPGCALFRRTDAVKNMLPEVPGARGLYGKDSGVGEDLLLFLLTALDYPYYGHLPEPLAVFLAHDGSITINASQSTGRERQLIAAYATAKDYFLSKAPSYAGTGPMDRLFHRVKWEQARVHDRVLSKAQQWLSSLGLGGRA